MLFLLRRRCERRWGQFRSVGSVVMTCTIWTTNRGGDAICNLYECFSSGSLNFHKVAEFFILFGNFNSYIFILTHLLYLYVITQKISNSIQPVITFLDDIIMSILVRDTSCGPCQSTIKKQIYIVGDTLKRSNYQ